MTGGDRQGLTLSRTLPERLVSLHMKRFLYLLLAAALVLPLMPGAVWAQEADGWNFEGEELPAGIAATLLPEGDPAAASVRPENGRLLLAADSTGASGSSARRIARADTEQTYTADPFLAVYFTLEVNDAPYDRSMGFRGAEDQAVLTVNGTALSVGGEPAGTMAAGTAHTVCVAAGNETIVAVDGAVVWRGDRILTAGGQYGVYFNNLGRSGGVDSKMYVDDLYLYTAGRYDPRANVKENETLSGLDSLDISFGIPLACAPSAVIEAEGAGAAAAVVELERDAVRIRPEGGFRQDQAYAVTISDILTADGTEQAPFSLRFTIAPAGYQPPAIRMEGLPELVRPGETVRARLFITSGYPEEEVLVYLDGQPEPVAGGIWEHTFTEPGTFQIYGTVRDTMGGTGRTETYTIRAAANEPPAIELLELDASAPPEDMETIRFRITDDTGLRAVRFAVNGQDVTRLAAANGDTYTLSGVPVSLGEMRLEAEAVDLDEETAFFSGTVEAVSGEMESRPGVQTGFDAGMSTPGIGYLQNLLEADVIKLPDKNNVLCLRQPQGVDQTNFRIYINVGTTALIGAGMDIYFPGEVSDAEIKGIVKGDGAQEWPAVYTVSGTSLTLAKDAGREEQRGVFSSGAWYRLETCVDPVRGIYWMWVNGNMVTPAGGYPFQGLTSQKAAEMRLEFILGQGQEVYVDNVETRWYSKCPQITAVTAQDGVVTAVLDSAFDSASLQAAAAEITLENGSQRAEISQVTYDSKADQIQLKLAVPLDTACEYRLTLPAGIAYGGGSRTAYPMVRYFTTQSRDFDVLDVHFTENGGRVSAAAVVQNHSAEARTIVMVMTEKSPAGAVEGVYSSQVVTVGPGTRETVSIDAAAAAEKAVSVFFLTDWTDCIPVKAAVYERK